MNSAIKLPLAGLRVADFCWIGAGSYTTKILGDMGADVIKIETSTRLDSLRVAGPYKDGKPGVNRSGYFADRNTSKPVVFRWFARPGGELFYFAGIWRKWEGDRGTKKAPKIGKYLLFSFLTTEPNGIVDLLHEKAMPVLIRTKDDAEQWREVPPEEALQLQKPAPVDAIVLLPAEKRVAELLTAR